MSRSFEEWWEEPSTCSWRDGRLDKTSRRVAEEAWRAGQQERGQASEIAEQAIFRWYGRVPEEHDMLTRSGLDELERAIKEILVEEGLARQ